MGTYYFCDETSFLIPAEKMPEAIKLLRAYAQEQYPTIQVDDDAAFLHEIAEEERWEVDIDPDGAISNVSFYERKGSPDLDWLNAMSSCIESGSYAQIHSDYDNLPYREMWLNGNSSIRVLPSWPSAQDLAFNPIPAAIALAFKYHGSQVRKASLVPGVSYMSHLMEVAGMVMSAGGDHITVAAAWLHDILEDVSQDIAHEIERECGPTVLSVIREVTEIGTGNGGEFKAPWKTRKVADIEHTGVLSQRALLLKVCEKLQSARSIVDIVDMYGDDAYASFAKKEYATVEERKAAVLWFHRSLVTAFLERYKVLKKGQINDLRLLAIQSRIFNFDNIVKHLEESV